MNDAKRPLVLLCLGLFAAAAICGAQTKSEKPATKMEAPKPGPEVKKLGYFVGTWKSQGEMKENPFGMPTGKYSSSDKCEWFTGGFHVVCHSTGSGPMGAMHGLGILAYNPQEKAYTYYGIDNSGFAESSKGKVDGNDWVFTADETIGGKTYHGRYSVTASSPDSYTYKYETSLDGRTWSVAVDGKSTKVGAAKK